MTPLPAAKKYCKRITNDIKGDLAISEKTGKPLLKLKTSRVGSYFAHESLTLPTKIGKELDNITEISITVEIKGGKYIHCKAPLLGTKIFFEE